MIDGLRFNHAHNLAVTLGISSDELQRMTVRVGRLVQVNHDAGTVTLEFLDTGGVEIISDIPFINSTDESFGLDRAGSDAEHTSDTATKQFPESGKAFWDSRCDKKEFDFGTPPMTSLPGSSTEILTLGKEVVDSDDPLKCAWEPTYAFQIVGNPILQEPIPEVCTGEVACRYNRRTWEAVLILIRREEESHDNTDAGGLVDGEAKTFINNYVTAIELDTGDYFVDEKYGEIKDLHFSACTSWSGAYPDPLDPLSNAEEWLKTINPIPFINQYWTPYEEEYTDHMERTRAAVVVYPVTCSPDYLEWDLASVTDFGCLQNGIGRLSGDYVDTSVESARNSYFAKTYGDDVEGSKMPGWYWYTFPKIDINKKIEFTSSQIAYHSSEAIGSSAEHNGATYTESISYAVEGDDGLVTTTVMNHTTLGTSTIRTNLGTLSATAYYRFVRSSTAGHFAKLDTETCCPYRLLFFVRNDFAEGLFSLDYPCTDSRTFFECTDVYIQTPSDIIDRDNYDEFWSSRNNILANKIKDKISFQARFDTINDKVNGGRAYQEYYLAYAPNNNFIKP